MPRFGQASPLPEDRAAPVAMPIPPITGLVAEFYARVAALAARRFDGDIDRGVIYGMLWGVALSRPAREGAISIHSAAFALGRPFETVRRHVAALVAAGLCQRTRHGIAIAPGPRADPVVDRSLSQLNNIFVAFMAGGVASGAFPAPARHPAGVARRPFRRDDGARLAIDLMLAIVDCHRPFVPDVVDLAIVAAVMEANARGWAGAADGAGPRAADGGPAAFDGAHAVRVATVARALGIGHATARRRAAGLAGPGGPLLRLRQGMVISPAWLAMIGSAAAGEGRHATLTLLLTRVAAAGFPFDAPASAYAALPAPRLAPVPGAAPVNIPEPASG